MRQASRIRGPMAWVAMPLLAVLAGAAFLFGPGTRSAAGPTPGLHPRASQASLPPPIATLANTTRSEWSYVKLAEDAYGLGIYGIAEVSGRLFAWGAIGDGKPLWFSDNGVSWQPVMDAPGFKSMAQLRGRLFAWGSKLVRNKQARMAVPATWVSDDGLHWRETRIPPPSIRGVDGYSVSQVIDTGDTLLAVVDSLVFPDGGPGAATIYLSSNGESWAPVKQLPPSSNMQTQLLQLGGAVLAVGADDVWRSTDGGYTWQVSASASELGGHVLAAAVHDGMIVGVGYADRQPPGGPTVWISSVAGDAWKPHRLAGRYQGSASQVLFGENGQILVFGSSFRAWLSNDRGQTWVASGRPQDTLHTYSPSVTRVPGGYVAIGEPEEERIFGQSVFRSTADGVTWTERSFLISTWAVAWTPTFGLVATGYRIDGPDLYAAMLAFAPNPYPLDASP